MKKNIEIVPVEKLFGELFEDFLFNEEFPGPGKAIQLTLEEASALVEKINKKAEEDPEFAKRLENMWLGKACRYVLVMHKILTHSKKKPKNDHIPEKYRKYFRPGIYYEYLTEEEKKEWQKEADKLPLPINWMDFHVFDPKNFGEPEVLEVKNNRLYINGKLAVDKPVVNHNLDIKYMKYEPSEEEKREWKEIVDELEFYEPVYVLIEEVEPGMFYFRFA